MWYVFVHKHGVCMFHKCIQHIRWQYDIIADLDEQEYAKYYVLLVKDGSDIWIVVLGEYFAVQLFLRCVAPRTFLV